MVREQVVSVSLNLKAARGHFLYVYGNGNVSFATIYIDKCIIFPLNTLILNPLS